MRRVRRALRGRRGLCLLGVVCVLLLLWQETLILESYDLRTEGSRSKPVSYQSPLELCHDWKEDERLRRQVQQTLDVFHSLVPNTFMSSHTSPCWLSDIDTQLTASLNRTISQRIRDTIPNMDTHYSTGEAEELIKMAATGRNNVVETTKRMFCLPSFYQAGFQKSGTTALYDMIASHPLLSEPHMKEGHFWRGFSESAARMPHQHRVLQVLHYLFHINPAGEAIKRNPKMLTVDASTSTITIEQHHELLDDRDTCLRPVVLSQLIPKVKMVVIMRNPANQLWSNYWFFCATENWRVNEMRAIPQKYREHGPEIFHNHTMEIIQAFKQCMNRADNTPVLECVRSACIGSVHSYDCQSANVGIGLYYYHLLPWLSTLPRQRFLFLRSEDLSSSPLGEIAKVWEFLGLPPISASWLTLSDQSWSTNRWIRKYRGDFQMLPATRTALEEFFRPHNEKLAKLLNDERFLWKDLMFNVVNI